MSAESRNQDDLELTEDSAAQVKGGLLPVEPGEDMSTRLPRTISTRKKKKKKKSAASSRVGGGRPV